MLKQCPIIIKGNRASIGRLNFHCYSKIYEYRSSANSLLENLRSTLNANNSVPPRGKYGNQQNNQKFRNSLEGKDSHRKQNKSNSNKRKKFVIKWNSGSERAKAAANSIIQQIFRLNRDGKIKTVDPISNTLRMSNIKKFASGLDLEKYGLSIVDIERINFNGFEQEIPLVKIMDSRSALQRYSNELAKQKEVELQALGLLKKKQNEPKKDNTIKHIKVSWKISDEDLENQKKNEILGLLKKGHNVYLYLDDKANTRSKDWLENFEDDLKDKEQNQKVCSTELRRRNSIASTLKEIAKDISIIQDIEGSVETKMILKLTPKQIPQNAVNKRELKEQRKKERQEKLRKRIEKKNKISLD